VAGELTGGKRKANKVTGRDVITLDLDHIPAGGTQGTLRRIEALGCAYAVYSTRKHEESKPRLRVLIPVNRMATADEYEPLSRKLASIIGIELCDPSTFEASRLMYWPSCCADSTYVYQYGDRSFLDVNGLLATYADWRNVAEWPEVPGAKQSHVKLAAKQGDPTAKAGVVGAFCRIYDIYGAIETFLPGEYTPCDNSPGRYTYTGGSTVGGAIVYDDGAFLYSHHATDPAGGRLVNAFDLVRLHRFADRDDDAKPDTPTNKLPSYTAMCEMAVADTQVASLLNQERYEKATQDFATAPDDDLSWMTKLAVSATTGTPAKTINNLLTILEHDPVLKGKIAYDEFSNRGLIIGSVPWDSRAGRRDWVDNDEFGLWNYLELVYDLSIRNKAEAALSLCSHNNSVHDVRSYLTNLQWDGAPRLDTTLIDYLGADDSPYVRAVARKSMVGAVARIMTPGCKYDQVPILAGRPGLGKSTFLKKIGKQWFSESLEVIEGKEAAELIQGTWINELGELKGFGRAKTEAIKQFLSKTEDIYRKPFGRNTAHYPRQSVFFGTTNSTEFLDDRRFWPIDVGVKNAVKDIFEDLDAEVDQLWAEAVMRWKLGESVCLSKELEQEAQEAREGHRENNANEGIIREFVERPVPVNWGKCTIAERRMYWSGEFGRTDTETVKRDRICAAEIWCECLNGDSKYMKRSDTLEINSVLNQIPGWIRQGKASRFGCYGVGRGGFIRE
jgi:putative DNA primase/helicase